jgi:hypothetical protein
MPPPPSKNNGNVDSEPSCPGLGALAICTAIIALLWLAVLPQIGNLPAVRATIRRNDSLGIDPSAKFYSELPAMPALLDHVRDARRQSAAPSPP